MNKRIPPPSLGKLQKKKRTKVNKYDEWHMMKQEVGQFEQVITSILFNQQYSRIRVFSVGSPRNFQVVVTAHFQGRKLYKRFRRDVRDSSGDFWLEQFEQAEWQVQNHVIDDHD